MFDYEGTLAGLNTLYAAAAAHGGKYNDQIREFIYFGEYPLALDGISDAYLTSNVRMPDHLFRVFEKLADDMDLARDPDNLA